MPDPPTFRKVNPADMPILNLALSSPTLPLSVVDEYAETMMAQRISMIDGVAQVSVYGAQKFAVRAQLDPSLMAARSIGIDEWRSHSACTTSTCPPALSGEPGRPSPFRPPASSIPPPRTAP